MKAAINNTFDETIKEFCQIEFFPEIDIEKIKKSLKESSKNHFTEQDLVYSILHKCSNYDEVVWSLYACDDSQFIDRQIKNALIEISNIDSSLTWACMEVLERYKSQFKIRKKKSSHIINCGVVYDS